jgi:hypothetical protein
MSAEADGPLAACVALPPSSSAATAGATSDACSHSCSISRLALELVGTRLVPRPRKALHLRIWPVGKLCGYAIVLCAATAL